MNEIEQTGSDVVADASASNNEEVAESVAPVGESTE